MKRTVLIIAVIIGAVSTIQGQTEDDRSARKPSTIHPIAQAILDNIRDYPQLQFTDTPPYLPAIEVTPPPPPPEVPKTPGYQTWDFRPPAIIEESNLPDISLLSDTTEEEKAGLELLKQTNPKRYARLYRKYKLRPYKRLLKGDIMMFVERYRWYPPRAFDRLLLTKGRIFESVQSKLKIRMEGIETFMGEKQRRLSVGWSTTMVLKPLNFGRFQF